MKKILCLFLCLFLPACGGSSSQKSRALTPMPGATGDPPDSALKAPMKRFIKSQNAPPHSEWDMIRIDLNDDGRRDAIVLFKLPHSFWCGWDGCGMLVLQATENSFVPLSTINNVRGPIYISDQRTNQWRDIIIRISGTKLRDKNIVMKFDGNSYPQSPLLAPDLEVPLSVLKTERFFL